MIEGMHSQHDEERYVVDYFGESRGRFLDIGAWCGLAFSNTYRLAQLGWAGVCVEPSPAACAALLRTHGDNPNISVVNAALAPEAGWRVLYDAGGDGISSLDSSAKDRWPDSTFRPLHVWAVTPGQLIERFVGTRFDFVTLDAEGMSWAILQRLPLAAMGTRLVCVEHDGMEADVLAHCAAEGLTELLLQNGENCIVGKPQ